MSGSDHPPGGDWERSERASFRIALAIALLPFLIALLIAWAAGDPPWRARPQPIEHGPEAVDHDGPGHPAGPGPH